MSKMYNLIPSNRKTLFLRNLETILINHGIMDEIKTKKFREDACNEILDLIGNFMLDSSSKNNDRMLENYLMNCAVIRWMDDRMKLLNIHSNQ